MQYLLTFPESSDHVVKELKTRLGFAPKVTLTNNRRSILSVRYKKGEPYLRIHKCFVRAPEDVMDAIAGFVKRRTTKQKALLGSFFDLNCPADDSPKQKRKRVINAVGVNCDLSLILNDLNERFFGGSVDAKITWGKSGTRRRRWFRKTRHITLGTYCRREKLIVIHPNLDKPKVPRYVVESIVFHEMCHQVVYGGVRNGRRRLHTRQFKEEEQRFPELPKARLWAKENMYYLLRNS